MANAFSSDLSIQSYSIKSSQSSQKAQMYQHSILPRVGYFVNSSNRRKYDICITGKSLSEADYFQIALNNFMHLKPAYGVICGG
jgi:hypothetical protein